MPPSVLVSPDIPLLPSRIVPGWGEKGVCCEVPLQFVLRLKNIGWLLLGCAYVWRGKLWEYMGIYMIIYGNTDFWNAINTFVHFASFSIIRHGSSSLFPLKIHVSYTCSTCFVHFINFCGMCPSARKKKKHCDYPRVGLPGASSGALTACATPAATALD